MHQEFGLRTWQGPVMAMPEPHQHSEIELNFVLRGEMRYLFGGRELRVQNGSWLAFWAAWPHHLTGFEPGTTCVWLTLPLATFLRFALPEAIGKAILHNRPILEQDAFDARMFERWSDAGPNVTGEPQRILELELEARFRRLALDLRTSPKRKPRVNTAAASKAEQLAEFISAHHLEPLGLSEITSAVGLNANYAAGLFKAQFGMTILEYLTQHRLAHAQRLLATGNQGVLELAFASGFGSSSRFYVAFERAAGCSPLEYRRRFRGSA